MAPKGKGGKKTGKVAERGMPVAKVKKNISKKGKVGRPAHGPAIAEAEPAAIAVAVVVPGDATPAPVAPAPAVPVAGPPAVPGGLVGNATPAPVAPAPAVPVAGPPAVPGGLAVGLVPIEVTGSTWAPRVNCSIAVAQSATDPCQLTIIDRDDYQAGEPVKRSLKWSMLFRGAFNPDGNPELTAMYGRINAFKVLVRVNPTTRPLFAVNLIAAAPWSAEERERVRVEVAGVLLRGVLKDKKHGLLRVEADDTGAAILKRPSLYSDKVQTVSFDVLLM